MKNKNVQNMPVQMIKIDELNATQRIDNYLICKLKGVPKSRIYRMLRKGEVRVNKGRTKAKYRLNSGDVVRIPPVRVATIQNRIVSQGLLDERLGGRVLYEDDQLLIFNKPSGLAVHGGSGLYFGVIEGLRQLRSEDRFLELVHRLDRDTSGCLLIAKKRSALRVLHTLFRDNRVSKFYLALLLGRLQSENMIVDVPLVKNVLKSGERMVAVSASGKSAITTFTVKQRFAEATLVQAQPKTGRTHQIRVHAAHLGYPIACDERYGCNEKNRVSRKYGLKRLFLHASSVRFEHPRTGKYIEVRAPLDEPLLEVLARLHT